MRELSSKIVHNEEVMLLMLAVSISTKILYSNIHTELKMFQSKDDIDKAIFEAKKVDKRSNAFSMKPEFYNASIVPEGDDKVLYIKDSNGELVYKGKIKDLIASYNKNASMSAEEESSEPTEPS